MTYGMDFFQGLFLRKLSTPHFPPFGKEVYHIKTDVHDHLEFIFLINHRGGQLTVSVNLLRRVVMMKNVLFFGILKKIQPRPSASFDMEGRILKLWEVKSGIPTNRTLV